MRKTVAGVAVFAMTIALTGPVFAGGSGGCGWGDSETAQTSPPVVAQTTVPFLPIIPTDDQPES